MYIYIYLFNFNLNWESERMNWCGGQHYNLYLFQFDA